MTFEISREGGEEADCAIRKRITTLPRVGIPRRHMLVPFAIDAVVKDEGRERRGRAAIREWMEETTRRSQPEFEVAEIVNEGRSTVVTAWASTTSGGARPRLRFAFKLDGRQIAHLEIS